MKIYFKKNSLSISKIGTVTGLISLNEKSFYFPEKGWNDLILIILNNWLSNIYDLKINRVHETELLFMDGPFEVKIKRENENILFLFFINNKHIDTKECLLKSFVEELIKVSKKLISELDLFNVNNSVKNELELNLKKFDRDIPRYPKSSK